MKKLLCLGGPTAVGKSSVAISLAKKLNTDIISADSVQVYRGLDIGSAKPSKTEQQAICHHLIDILNPDQTYSAFDFSENVSHLLQQKQFENKIPFLAGGTAFYLDSLLFKLDFEVDEQTLLLREEYKKIYQSQGVDALYEMLLRVDKASAEKIHKNNVKRVIRALEVAHNGGSLSGQRTKQPQYDYTLVALTMERERLYERINSRVDIMIEQGLIEEVESLFKRYPDRNLQSLQSIGYKEVIAYLCGEVSREQSILDIKQHTRNYAKRQISYLKRLNPIWVNVQDGAKENCLVDEIFEIYQKEQI